MNKSLMLIACSLLVSKPALCEENILNIESTITGSHEQPKILYIVPWQPPEGSENLYQPIIRGPIEDQILSPIDREVFQRRVQYYQRLNSSVHKEER